MTAFKENSNVLFILSHSSYAFQHYFLILKSTLMVTPFSTMLPHFPRRHVCLTSSISLSLSMCDWICLVGMTVNFYEEMAESMYECCMSLNE